MVGHSKQANSFITSPKNEYQ